MVNLYQWLASHFSLTESLNPLAAIDTTDISLDSREICSGAVFLAVIGHQLDGREYVTDAVANGASAVLVETENEAEHLHLDWLQQVPVLNIYDLKSQISALAANYFAGPSRKVDVIGVTGTNGKTSTVRFIAELLEQLQMPTATIGTLGSQIHGRQLTTLNTTPDAVTVQRVIADVVKAKVKTVAMEVSSHALSQGRVSHVDFDTAIFTNLSRDHLDYHGTMEAYGAAKQGLFLMPSLRHAIINIDDQFGLAMVKSIAQHSPHLDIWTIGHVAQHSPRHVQIIQCRCTPGGMDAVIQINTDRYHFNLPLLGEFNLMNVVAAMTALAAHDVSWESLTAKVSSLRAVPGRMESFQSTTGVTAVVDYAHSPDALEQALDALAAHCQQTLWCVFGCGGDRDVGKRPLMAKAAEKADRVVVTSDNPRTEDPNQIIKDIVAGFSRLDGKVEVELDRKSAITHALVNAKAGDIVLIAGKGHETYQQVGHEFLDYNERDFVKTMCAGEAS